MCDKKLKTSFIKISPKKKKKKNLRQKAKSYLAFAKTYHLP